MAEENADIVGSISIVWPRTKNARENNGGPNWMEEVPASGFFVVCEFLDIEGKIAAPPPQEKAGIETLIFEGTEISPLGLVVQPSTSLIFENREDHPIRIFVENVKVNLELPIASKSSIAVPSLKATLHPYIIRVAGSPRARSSVMVRNHRYAAVANASGRFWISSVPPGMWLLTIHQPPRGIVNRALKDGVEYSVRKGELKLKFAAGLNDLGNIMIQR